MDDEHNTTNKMKHMYLAKQKKFDFQVVCHKTFLQRQKLQASMVLMVNSA